jgi:NADH:ubiquinone oxidoreductase subunit C
MSNPAPNAQLPTEEKAIVDAISSKFGDRAKVVFSKPNRIKISAARENMFVVAKFIRDELHFDHCANVTGTDFPKEKQLEVTYHFGSLDVQNQRRIILALACRLPISDPTTPTLIDLFPSVNYHERELKEMLGIDVIGHPNMSRLLLPEDWDDIPPMLKAYRLPGRLEGE